MQERRPSSTPEWSETAETGEGTKIRDLFNVDVSGTPSAAIRLTEGLYNNDKAAFGLTLLFKNGGENPVAQLAESIVLLGEAFSFSLFSIMLEKPINKERKERNR